MRIRLAAPLLALLLTACEEVEQVVDGLRESTPHEAYRASLEHAGLAETALGRDWLRAAEEAVLRPHRVQLPFEEAGYIAPESPGAVGYHFSLTRGQVLTVRTEVQAEDSLALFVDLFRVPENPADPLRPVPEADTVAPGEWRYEPSRSGEFLLRLQPELLRGGRYRLLLTLAPALAFPVEGRGAADIGSGFGASRDGGARSHAGIDIFAPRGTPALAASDGVVSRVQVTGLGGKVVWIQDARRTANLYYAHLDSQMVARGQRVRVGDTIGLVGNTGNAVTTPPHLHFGIYARGAVDPDPFVRPPRRRLPQLTADLDHLGSWARTQGRLPLRLAPDEAAEGAGEALEPRAPLRVLGGSGGWFRVQAPDGRQGWVPARLTESAERALSEIRTAQGTPLRARPLDTAPVVEELGEGAPLSVHGSFAGFQLVETPSSVRGWISPRE